MSDMMMPPDPFDDDNDVELDPEDKVRMDAFNLDVERIAVQQEDFAKALEKLGIYLEHAQIQPVDTPFGPKPAIVAMGTVGRVAFTDRTQDPEQSEMDEQFRVIEAATAVETLDEERERIKRNIAAGRDPLDDGDDDGS